MSNIKLILADDHALIRTGLKNIIVTNTNLELLQEFDNGKDALEYILGNVPDLALLDINMPGLSGFDVCKQIRANNLPTKVLFLTMFDQENMYKEARKIGANGYLLKDFIIEELFLAIETIFKDIFYVNNKLFDNFNRITGDHQQNKLIKELLLQLTNTERKVLELIALNLNTNQIAAKLFSSELTIKTHRKNIIRKLKLENEQNSLTKFAIQNVSYLK
jgi:DNA-binding NarL/FixJ family response regulator